MPTYAYACTHCGHRFDAVQSFTDATLTECPECGGALRKEYGSIGVTFNGSGFYRTDSRAGGASAKDGGSGSKDGGSTSKSGDSGSTSASSSSGASAPAAPAAS
ncbi:FmdB family zinc ribbon protein [Microbacterium sp. NPDC089189]|uniref:FmdB family zinc ribbon protein n=1 Tax=Microbacterium sp. NPDC089189 TaxID=3154972 RepID=UPI00343A8ECB